METIKHALAYQLWGIAVGWWLVGGAVFAAQEAIARSPKLKANTYVQAVGNIAAKLKGTVLGKFPVLAQVLAILGAMQTPTPPTMAEQAEKKAVNS